MGRNTRIYELGSCRWLDDFRWTACCPDQMIRRGTWEERGLEIGGLLYGAGFEAHQYHPSRTAEVEAEPLSMGTLQLLGGHRRFAGLAGP